MLSPVRVSATEPDASSGAEGVYTTFSEFALGVNVPEPPLQVTLLTPLPALPERDTEDPAHIVWSGPAFTVVLIIVTTIKSLFAGQGPGGSVEVSVSVKVPAVISAAVGV